MLEIKNCNASELELNSLLIIQALQSIFLLKAKANVK